MYVLKIFITGYFCNFGLASYTKNPRNMSNSRLKYAYENYFDLKWTFISCNFVTT